MKKTDKKKELIIIELYVEKNMSTVEISKKVNLSSTAILNILKRNGCKLRSIKEAKKGKLRGSNLPQQMIIKKYIEELKSSRKIADELHISHRSVLNVLNENNIKVRPSYFNYKNPLEDEVVKLYKEEKKSIKKICEVVGMSYGGVNKILKKLNIIRTEEKGNSGRIQTLETKEKIRVTWEKRKEEGLYDHIYLKKTGYTYKEFFKTLPELRKYYNEVIKETNKQPLKELKNYNKRGKAGTKGAYHLDHKYSIYCGFKNKVLPKIIGNICNLEIIPWEENIAKHSSCSILLEDLLKEYSKH